MLSISDITKNSLNYPFNGVSKVLVTALIYLLGSLFLLTSLTFLFPNFMESFTISSEVNIFSISSAMICIILAFMVFLILIGYNYRVIEKTIRIENKLPEYDDIFLMLIQGFKIIIIEIIYQILPIILLILGVILLKFATNNALLFYVAIVLIIISLILSLLIGFFSVMAINNFIVDKGKLLKAFAFKEIWDLIKSVGLLKYLGTIIFFILIQTIILFAMSILIGILSVFATIAGPFGLFLVSIIGVIYLVTEAYCMIFISRGYALLYCSTI